MHGGAGREAIGAGGRSDRDHRHISRLPFHYPHTGQEVLLNTRLQVAKGNWGSPHIAGDVGVFAGRIEFDRRQRVVLVSVNVLVFVNVRGGGVKFRSNVPGVLRVK